MMRILVGLSAAVLVAGCVSKSEPREAAQIEFRSGEVGTAERAARTEQTAGSQLPQGGQPAPLAGRDYGSDTAFAGGGVVELPVPGVRVSSSPAVQEAAELRPEQMARPGGAKVLPKDNPDARRIVIQRGQSLYDVSHEHAVNLRALIETNNLKPPYAMEIGQVVYLPKTNIHVVEKGETLYGVSRRYNVDTRSLAIMNGLKRPWTVWPGDELELPALARDQGGRTRSRAVASANTVRVNSRVSNPVPNSQLAPDSTGPVSLMGGAKSLEDARRVGVSNGGGKNRFLWPVEGQILRGYGDNDDGTQNDGVNISARRGQAVIASADGHVVYVGDELTGFGNLVLLQHSGGWVSAYAHAERVLVQEGQSVRQGESIAQAGATGSATQVQVHFELRKGRNPVDPTPLMPKA